MHQTVSVLRAEMMTRSLHILAGQGHKFRS